MPRNKNLDARRAVRAAQKRYEEDRAAANKARKEAFAQAQKEGLTLRDIAEEVGLHHSRISQILEGK